MDVYGSWILIDECSLIAESMRNIFEYNAANIMLLCHHFFFNCLHTLTNIKYLLIYTLIFTLMNIKIN